MVRDTSTAHSETPQHLKYFALKLFAERGIDGVTVRQIAEAAGQKNHAAITYHFGSKEALIRELVIDGARAIDERRNAALDRARAAGGPHSLSEVMEILVETSVDPAPPAEGECYNRFVVSLLSSNRSLFLDALDGKWNSGYQRCLDEIRRLLPEVRADVINQKLVFMGMAMGGILAGREAELADRTREHPMWNDRRTLGRVAKGLAALVES